MSTLQGTYESLFEYAAEGIFQTLPDGRYLRVNPALARIYKYDSPAALQSDLTDIANQLYVESNRRDEFMAMMDKYDYVSDFESQIRCKDGSVRWISENARAVRNVEGRLEYYEGFVSDITARKDAEARHRILEQELRQAHSMSSVAHLANGISHDFKTILTLISSHTELAQEKRLRHMDTAVDDHLKHILAVVDRGCSMINQIGLLNAFKEPRKEPVQLDKLLKDVIRMLRSSIPYSIHLRQRIDLDIGTVYADPSEIFRVVINLCTNAFRAMAEEGGVLHIALGVVTTNREGMPTLEPGEYIELSISDTGAGIAEEDLDGIFSSSYSTKKDEVIRGYGLNIVRGIIEGLDGHITVKSKEDEGTTFTIYLPVHQVPKKPEAAMSRLSKQIRTTIGLPASSV